MKRSDGPPDFFKPAGTAGRGVRRLNRVPLLLIGGMVVVVMSVFGYTLYDRNKAIQQQATANVQQHSGAPADAAFVLSGAPADGIIPADRGSSPTAPSLPPGALQPAALGLKSAPPLAADTATLRRTQLQEQIETNRINALQNALGAASTIPRPPAVQTSAPSYSAPLPGQPNRPVAEANDVNGQAAKAAFLKKQAPDSSNLLATTREAPLSPYEIRAGTVIPAVLIGGVNSDLPGQLLGQVSENVYDTATGQHLLIPQGAKLVGTYDNAVTYGQHRVLVVWTRIIFPDASALDLNGMPGADQSGYAGFNDQVDNHYLRVFGSAVLMSLFSAGVQLSQPQASNGENYSSSQVIAGALGQQLGQAGLATVQRNLGIAPTLTIRPGYLFTVMVTKDVVVPGAWPERQHQ
ncbi:MAG: TrbI/VirB10 family protein [Bacteroidota bacterium]